MHRHARRSIWEAFGDDTAVAWTERPTAGLAVGDLDVLGLSDQAARCLQAGEISTVDDLIVATEEELLELSNLGESTLDEIGDRLVAAGFVPPEDRETLFSTVQPVWVFAEGDNA